MSLRVVLVLLLVCGLGSGEIFTSVKDLTEIFSLEKRVMDALKDYVQDTEEEIATMKMFLEDYEKMRRNVESLQSESDEEERWPEEMVGNPIHVFQLIRRLTESWNFLESYNPSEDWQEVEETLIAGKRFDLISLTNEEDLHEAAKSVITLQSFYRLNVSKIAQGNIWGVQGSADLSAEECHFLGHKAMHDENYYSAIEWLEHSYHLADQDADEIVSQTQIKEYIEKAKEKLNSGGKDIDFFSEARERHSDMARENFRRGRIPSSTDDFENFQTLCRGEQLLSEEYRATLHCYYDSRNVSYLLLMPGKVEKLLHEPRILLFHDVISDKEITQIKKFAHSNLSRAKVFGPEGKGSVSSNSRLAQVARLNSSEEMKILWRLNQRTTYLSGLSANPLDDSAEKLQIGNYGVGGLYYAHRDYILVDKTAKQLQEMKQNVIRPGDRIATWMFYLSDVIRGGATAFPRLGVSVLPLKGSAVFWYNLKKSGQGDTNTLHGGCPVVYGNKWVANKWFRENGQFLRRPCGLSEEE